MRRLFTKIGSLAAAAMLALTAAQPAEAGPVQRPAAETAYFEFTDISRETAVFQLTDPVKIEKARKILSGEETYETHVVGRIVKRPAPYNRTWSFHFNPDTISFFCRPSRCVTRRFPTWKTTSTKPPARSCPADTGARGPRSWYGKSPHRRPAP